jgi:DNA modification methylase
MDVLRLLDARYERRTRLDRLRVDCAGNGERGCGMRTFYDGKVTLHAGDCLDVLKAMPEDSIDAVVTDPPYHLTSIVKRFSKDGYSKSNLEQPVDKNLDGIMAGSFRRLAKGFMGKQWDGGDIAFRPELWAEVLRVLKPGGHMVCFGGTRTYHRMVCAIEDAGFEVRDQLAWIYGSGFPKSHDVSKGIDRASGAGRTDVIGSKLGRPGMSKDGSNQRSGFDHAFGGEMSAIMTTDITAPATDATRQWQGWGTALKPAWEPICLARRPLSESTVAANVLRWGTGALNIDGCRIEGIPRTIHERGNVLGKRDGQNVYGKHAEGLEYSGASGRWPANLCHDGSAEVLAEFPETADSKAHWRNNNNQGHEGWGNGTIRSGPLYSDYSDSGSAARFFYTAKADANDRLNSKHPTVKPVDLMQWLVRLVCPKGATVLDPFAGTGTTGAAAFIEGCRAVLIEREAEYLADIERRMELLLSGPDERSRKLAKLDPHETLPLFA